MSIKKSFGIICFRNGPNGHQLLMVKKATTYHFCEFAAGRYKKQNLTHMAALFNNMTYFEKMDILSLKYQNIWYRIYRENPDKVFLQNSNSVWISSYLKKKAKFETSFLNDGGERLRKLISNSNNSETIWEFPKGRRNIASKETEIETAIREFYEETNITEDKYSILWHVPPYVETYTDFGVTYQNVYYFANAIGTWEPSLLFYNKHQISEVAAIGWLSKINLQHMKLDPITHNRLMTSFSKIIKKYKNHL